MPLRRTCLMGFAGVCLALGMIDVALVQPGEAQAVSGERFKELARQSLARISGDVALTGLREPVEIIRDRWGVPHIYAQNADDLFFAQGYVMGQDRLWQLELWRRSREGRLSEVLGAAAFDRDRQARLLKYRGPMDDREWTSYHPETKRIMTAFVSGLNAFIAQNADNLPVEFRMTGVRPEPWTPETPLLRSPSFGDASSELQLARSVARLGVQQANRLRAPDPWDDLTVPEGLDVRLIGEEVLAGVRGGGGSLPRPALLEPYQAWVSGPGDGPAEAVREPGSNNWVVGGARTATGKPLVANDPHREVSNPSLRYIVHLNAPGWNVIGAGEPPFVGVALGHNDRLAWGFTIVGTDQHDVYVEELNPANPTEVRWNGQWEPMRIVREEIRIKGAAPRVVDLKYTRHGAVFHEDVRNHRAYALRSALDEPGTAAYLGGLRLAQARDCREFLEGAMSWKAPSENLICGDVDGNIAWQASALTPARKGWVGRLPVPGSGQYEWQGFRSDLPRLLNPARGHIATANNNIHPTGYSPPVMFKSSTNLAFDRITRLEQLLADRKRLTVDDFKRMQHDAYSLRAAADREFFKGWTAGSASAERARAMLADWDATLRKESAAAAIYATWRSTANERTFDASTPSAQRRKLVEEGLTKAIAKLTSDQGADWAGWRYGRMHMRRFPHPLLSAFDLPSAERSGGSGSVAADGATYREILDVADWDRSVATNTPGQSGQPESPFYGNLLTLEANDEYFPLVFSRARVDQEAAHRLMLRPQSTSAQRQ